MPDSSPRSPLQTALQERVRQEGLPPNYLDALVPVLLPCADRMTRSARKQRSAPIWGICGPQGSGKSTLVQFLAEILRHRHGLRAVALSLDDVYHTRATRQRLAASIHPLLATRGVPGTHDVALGRSTLDALRSAVPSAMTALPRFNKSRDDRVPESQWPRWMGRPDLILFEGWCVGTPPEPEARLVAPCNDLEAVEDAEGVWRRHVNQQLAGDYREWWQQLDGRVFLAIPDFRLVAQWRTLQEDKLRERLRQAGQPLPDTLLSAEQIQRFVAHYERLTRWNLEILPSMADVVLTLQDDHRLRDCALRSV